MKMNKFSPKKILLFYVTVTLCIHLGCADDFYPQRSDDAEEVSGQNEGRAISLEAASHPAGDDTFTIINIMSSFKKPSSLISLSPNIVTG